MANGARLAATRRAAWDAPERSTVQERFYRELMAVDRLPSAPEIAQRLLRSLNTAQGAPRIFGVYDDQAPTLPQRCMGHAILGSVDQLVQDARVHRIDSIIVALPSTSDHLLVETLNKLSLVPVDVKLCPGEFAMRLGTVQASHIGGHTFLNVIDRPLRDWRWIAKTVEDRILAFLEYLTTERQVSIGTRNHRLPALLPPEIRWAHVLRQLFRPPTWRNRRRGRRVDR